MLSKKAILVHAEQLMRQGKSRSQAVDEALRAAGYRAEPKRSAMSSSAPSPMPTPAATPATKPPSTAR